MTELISFLYQCITSSDICFKKHQDNDFPIKEFEISNPSIDLLNQLFTEQDNVNVVHNDNIISIDMNRGLMMRHHKRELERKMFRAYSSI